MNTFKFFREECCVSIRYEYLKKKFNSVNGSSNLNYSNKFIHKRSSTILSFSIIDQDDW